MQILGGRLNSATDPLEYRCPALSHAPCATPWGGAAGADGRADPALLLFSPMLTQLTPAESGVGPDEDWSQAGRRLDSGESMSCLFTVRTAISVLCGTSDVDAHPPGSLSRPSACPAAKNFLIG